jgi:hypothetical protein
MTASEFKIYLKMKGRRTDPRINKPLDIKVKYDIFQNM